MKLKARTTYLNGNGDRVCIAGHAKREVNGQQCWWSIQGDHYTDDGRFVFSRRVVQHKDGKRFEALEAFTHDDNHCNLKEEDTSEAAKRWWDGVKT